MYSGSFGNHKIWDDFHVLSVTNLFHPGQSEEKQPHNSLKWTKRSRIRLPVCERSSR